MKVLMKAGFSDLLWFFRDSWEYAGLSYLALNRENSVLVALNMRRTVFCLLCCSFQGEKRLYWRCCSAICYEKGLACYRRRIRTELTEQKKVLSTLFWTGTCAIFSWLLRWVRVVLDLTLPARCQVSCRGCNRENADNSRYLSCQTSLCSSNRRSQERFGRLDWVILWLDF